MHRTKIVVTLGPASSSPEVLRRLVEVGMNVARLNFSHGSHEEHARQIASLRAIAVGVALLIFGIGSVISVIVSAKYIDAHLRPLIVVMLAGWFAGIGREIHRVYVAGLFRRGDCRRILFQADAAIVLSMRLQ